MIYVFWAGKNTSPNNYSVRDNFFWFSAEILPSPLHIDIHYYLKHSPLNIITKKYAQTALVVIFYEYLTFRVLYYSISA